MAETRNDEAEVLYHSCATEFGPALERLAVAYEADFDLRRDLLQEIHTALWRSFKEFNGRCSLRTWVFRVAHNTAASHVVRNLRHTAREWVDLESVNIAVCGENSTIRRIEIDRLMELIQKLRPLDKQIMLLYLEGLDTQGIADVSGISASNVTTKIGRIKEILAHQLRKGENGNATGSASRGHATGLARTTSELDAADVELATAHRGRLPAEATRR